MWFLLELLRELLGRLSSLICQLLTGLWEMVQNMPDDIRLIGSSLLFTIAMLLLFLLFQFLRDSYSWLCGRPSADSVIDTDDESEDTD